MKAKSIIAAVCVLLVAAFAAPYVFAEKAQKETVVFTVEPKMHCHNCENKIKTNMRFEAGVTDIATDVKSNTVTITFDANKTNVESLQKAFKEIGYTATPATN